MLVRYVRRVIQVLGAIGVALIFIMILSTVTDVSRRFMLNSPLVGTIELNRTLLVFVVLFALAYTQLVNQHVRVDIVLERLPATPRALLKGFELLALLIVMGFVVYGSYIVAYKATVEGEYETGVINFPMWPGRIVIVVGLLALSVQYALEIVDNFRSALRNHSNR